MKTWRLVITYTAQGWKTEESSQIDDAENPASSTQSLEAEKMRMMLAEPEIAAKSVDPILASNAETMEERLPDAARPHRFIMFGLGLSHPNEVPSQSETLLLQR